MTKNKNVPELRFPDFTDNWKYKKISSLLKKVVIPVNVDESTLYKQIGIRSHGKGIFYKELVSGKELGNKRVFWVKENTFVVNIVFAWEQAVAITTNNEIGMIASHRFPMYKTIDNESYLKYILFFFLTKRGKELLELASPGGAGRNKTLGQKEFENLKFNIPNVDEQKKIADFLTSIDKKIEQLTKKKELLEKYKKGVMQKIFSQEIRFKDDNGNDFSDWEYEKLGNICKIAKSGGTPLSTKNEYYNGDIPFLSISDMTLQGKYLKYTTKSISKEGLENSSSWIVPINSIIFSMYASVGFVSINKIPLATSQAVINLVLKEGFYKEYIYYFLYNIKPELIKFIETGTQSNLNAQTVKSISVKLPYFDEQKKIADFLTSIDKKIDLVSFELEKIQLWKKGLLQKLFI